MRPVLHQDVVAAARVLWGLPEDARTQAVARLIRTAQIADMHRAETGKAHRFFGDGTLQSACAALPKIKEGRPDDPEYAACLVLVLEAVIEVRSRAHR